MSMPLLFSFPVHWFAAKMGLCKIRWGTGNVRLSCLVSHPSSILERLQKVNWSLCEVPAHLFSTRHMIEESLCLEQFIYIYIAIWPYLTSSAAYISFKACFYPSTCLLNCWIIQSCSNVWLGRALTPSVPEGSRALSSIGSCAPRLHRSHRLHYALYSDADCRNTGLFPLFSKWERSPLWQVNGSCGW